MDLVGLELIPSASFSQVLGFFIHKFDTCQVSLAELFIFLDLRFCHLKMEKVLKVGDF